LEQILTDTTSRIANVIRYVLKLFVEVSMIALYARSSTERQSKGLDAQIVALQEFCRSRGFKESEIKLYQDFGISGAKKSRPALDSLIADMQQGSITSIYVYSISRLSRSLKDLLELMNQFENHAVEFESLTEAFNLKSPLVDCWFPFLVHLRRWSERFYLSEQKTV
jgi:DNA invertase Pin-like site-specific DNA recombinase